jgi:hypothetical protein
VGSIRAVLFRIPIARAYTASIHTLAPCLSDDIHVSPNHAPGVEMLPGRRCGIPPASRLQY